MSKPLYIYPQRYARENKELCIYTESRNENIDCKCGIEWILRSNFDGVRLHGECAKELCEKYGIERVGWVLANTVQHYSWDTRFRPHTRIWADKFPIPVAIEDMTSDYVVGSHPELVNGLIDQYRSYVHMVDVLSSAACVFGSEEHNYEGKLLIIKPSSLKENYRYCVNQYFLAESDPGCDCGVEDGVVVGRFISDGEPARFLRKEFYGEADMYGIPDWVRRRYDDLNSSNENNACEMRNVE